MPKSRMCRLDLDADLYGRIQDGARHHKTSMGGFLGTLVSDAAAAKKMPRSEIERIVGQYFLF